MDPQAKTIPNSSQSKHKCHFNSWVFGGGLSCLALLVLLSPNTFWFSNLMTLSVPDEGYSRYATCELN